MKYYDVVILGGGASGLMAAIQAARRGKHIAIIEKNDQVGRKILMTGNGRCNLTNKNVVEDYKKPVHYFGQNPKFVISILNKFGLDQTKDFFDKLGILFHEEENGRLFPLSNQAQSIVDVLLYEIRNLKVKIIKPNFPKEINFDKVKNKFKLSMNDGQELSTPKLIIASGGLSHRELGATPIGYEIAKQFGHKIIPTFPAYVGLRTKSPLCHKLQGVKLEAAVKAISNNKIIAENIGTLMFAHFGLSAPAVLEISREIAYELEIMKKEVYLEINFLPAINKNNFDQFILNRWNKMPSKTLDQSFVGLLPKKVFPALLEKSSIDGDKKISEVDKNLRKQIINLLSSYKFKIEAVRGFEEAHFTAGGVDTKQIDPKTLESKLQKGLYFCGEVVDIDGECGGYNLQWAWSSGAVAGMSI